MSFGTPVLVLREGLICGRFLAGLPLVLTSSVPSYPDQSYVVLTCTKLDGNSEG